MSVRQARRESDRTMSLPRVAKPRVAATGVGHRTANELINWYFEPSQPLGIISGLKETFIKINKAEKTNTAEIRPEEQSQKTESCREN